MSGPEERALLELNLRRETWCQVEGDPRQCRERTERRHYRRHLRTSPALLTALTAAAPQQRRAACTERPGPERPGPERPGPERPGPAALPERRHFEESYKSHLV
ncbi:spermatogenesis-associated protein 45 isoform X2 [Trachinotus anak]|uniref:spermatogenesis-associated protein 45 isoform X2 n=1 Tax=Trachinotus anak TaxID=443729 RepID=UPI0039F196D8